MGLWDSVPVSVASVKEDVLNLSLVMMPLSLLT